MDYVEETENCFITWDVFQTLMCDFCELVPYEEILSKLCQSPVLKRSLASTDVGSVWRSAGL